MDARLTDALAGGLALYVHIPFCSSRCPYCDFNTYAGIEALIPDYVRALEAEMAAWGRLLGRPAAKTVYFGGGTPSCLPPRDLVALCNAARRAFTVRDDAEVSLEANPGDCDRARLSTYAEAGFNRLSIGAQSFDDAALRALGRRHDSAAAPAAVENARAAGFSNVSLDLIFGIPGQTAEQWARSLEGALSLGPEHLSLYGLALEPGTPLAEWVREGRVEDPDPDLAADMYELAEDRLAHASFRHYEISNWARPGSECRHNLAYWRMEPYLGVGAGAHSFLPEHRFANVAAPRTYVARLLPGREPRTDARPPAAMLEAGAVDSVEDVTPQSLMADTMMMELRLDTGVDGAAFLARFGRTLDDGFGVVIDELSEAGLLEADGDGIRLTRRGRLLGNHAFGRFVDAAKGRPPQGQRAGGTTDKPGGKAHCGRALPRVNMKRPD